MTSLLPHLVALLLAWMPTEVEAVGWHILLRAPFDADVTLAVLDSESGNLHGVARDTVVSNGNVGPLQVNMPTHCRRLGYKTRDECLPALQNRHRNLAVGVGILIAYHAKYGTGPGVIGDRAGRHRSWVWFWNASEQAYIFESKVIRKVERWQRLRAKRW